ncbi:ribonuclease H-like domain-containing protein [Lysobacter sp. A3-1-A15]|uniref:ribonuclease H-like domain-containing protein n=1 Tax=Novilysobacter viscosus TaxID=3098602 RepID=UPI002EDB7430
MSVTLERLRALKRQAGTAAPAEPGAPVLPQGCATASIPPAHAPAANDGAAMTSIDTLRRLLGVRERKPFVAMARGPVDRTLPGDEIAPGLRLLESHLPLPAPVAPLPLAFAKREGEHVDPRDLLFFDTETTGLAGGTGTRAFQVGAADWFVHPVHGDGLRVRQLLITTLAAEVAMLREFAGWLAPSTVLSSYNGRCYDAPLLKTRYRLARLPCPITPLDHVDLLFPTRRRYRGTWENCRLATVERELLGIVREDDLPGSQAPAAWLSYLRGGPSSLLRRVCAHNHQDVVTLARLMQRLVAVHDADTPATD